MAIVHILLFEFKPTTHHTEVLKLCDELLALRENCLHPTTKKPYLKDVRGGRDNSPEGHQGGFTHGFVAEFETEEDRKYYLEKDPAHLGFVKNLQPHLQNVRVVDFVPGVF